jgi:hypothetical protein
VDHQRALVYSCAVRERGEANGKPLGVLGIVFNWDALGQVILDRLPLSNVKKQRAIACFVDPSGQILADYPARSLGEQLELKMFEGVGRQSKGYEVRDFRGKSYCIGYAKSQGFETYATGWHSLVMLSREK